MDVSCMATLKSLYVAVMGETISIYPSLLLRLWILGSQREQLLERSRTT